MKLNYNEAVCSDLRKIFSSADRAQAEVAIEAFEQRWTKYPEIKPKCEENRTELMAFMDYGSHIRRRIYTTNPVEAQHRIMRKVSKTKAKQNEESNRKYSINYGYTDTFVI